MSDTPKTDAAVDGWNAMHTGIVGVVNADAMRLLELAYAELLAALQKASALVGSIPAGTLGTQEPAYQALNVIEEAIAKATQQ